MKSTLNGEVPEYIGADLTDRYSDGCRDVDVCGLTPVENKLAAKFWYWKWDPGLRPLDVSIIASELVATRSAMLDGPQGLASQGNSLRACERLSAAVGNTPDARPCLSRPFAGFICSSLDLFTALKQAGLTISPPNFLGGVSEVYPGHIWTILSGDRALSKKSTDRGRRERKLILEALGVCGLPVLPTHDQNDACVAALMAAAADRKIPGLTSAGIGFPLLADADGSLREGPMVIPELSSKTAALISRALSDVPRLGPGGMRPRHSGADSESNGPLDKANDLLDQLVRKALEGDPLVCTYAWAYRCVFNASFRKWSQAYANRVIEVARHTHLRELPGLGPVRLDAFVVSKSDGRPSAGHWESAHYDREEWERSLGNALVLD